jgi:phosphoglycolate phosphatase-like HAD superfamily hydrolase
MSEKRIINNLHKILSVSQSVKLERVRQALQLEQENFDEKIFKWATQFGFKIDGEYLKTTGGDVNDFLSHLQSQLESWKVNNSEIIGKFENASKTKTISDLDNKENSIGRIAIVFDLDGTLINSTEIGKKIEKEIFSTFDLSIDEETEKEIDQLTYEIMHGENEKNLGRKLMWAIFKKLGLNFFQRLRALYISAKIFKEENKKVKLYENVRETLDFLDKNNCDYAITTTSSKGEVESRLAKFPEVYSRFDGKIITRSDVENLKPHPESINKASTIMNIPTERLVMVGDLHSDILMGKEVNSLTIAVLTGIFSKEQFLEYEPDFILDSVAGIPDIFDHIMEKLNNNSKKRNHLIN